MSWYKPLTFLLTGKVTSLVAKKDLLLATRIEEAIRKNESLEALSVDNLRRDVARAKISEQKAKNANLVKVSKQNKTKVEPVKPSSKVASSQTSGRKTLGTKLGKASSPTKSKKTVKILKPSKKPSSAGSGRKRALSGVIKQADKKRSSSGKASTLKLSVVGFRGRSSSSIKN